ncbi:head maturation protease [Arthrobacter phage Eileen]|uniref:MuF-like minor capsid protein n=2 Tax=Bridgettevirus TaxID=2733170 RepID=A0A3G2KI71_9CAUD|nr:head maturation protease [Arthrobacter phage Eileen]YP_009815554.1 head maturation protease [Arthrobacter phage Peas]AYN57796.1 MuF-like minor capsid protein [Arthrobacter phage Eileen]AYN58693.1 MuF-like minor capsid protein [Arthrobacter phage Peas]
MYPEAATAHYRLMQRLQTVAVVAGRRAWANITPGDLSGSWVQGLAVLAGIVTTQQERAAVAGAGYVTDALAAQGEYVAPEAFLNPAAFAGQAADGRPLNTLLYSPLTTAKQQLADGASVTSALAAGRGALDTIIRATVADAGRAAAGVNIASRTGVGYVRMLNPPSCSRCSVLAGRFYRWNAGFDRHPLCDCVHVPAKGADSAKSEGLIHDPYEYFNSLSEAEQNSRYTKAGAQAIRDGGDIFQIVNSRRGMKPGGLVTTEGTTRRGNFGRKGRLTPEGIYQQAGSREEALRLLEANGYILPGGQNPLGSLRGQREGFGQLGRGGTRVGAREAVLEARRTGVRTGARATMTAAELRVFDARARWDQVRKGVNPFNPKRPLTPEIAARVERDFRKYILGY